jgi:hypothetical protein
MPCPSDISLPFAANSNARTNFLGSARTHNPVSPQDSSSDIGPVHRHEGIRGVSSIEKKHRTSRPGDLDVGIHILFQKAFRTEAPRQLYITRIKYADSHLA